MLLLLWACTGAPESDTAAVCLADTDPAAVTWDNWGEDFFTSYCDSCHSARTPDRRGAPESAVFDTEAQVVAQLSRVQARVLDEETMPLGGGVFPDDLILLAAYIKCATAK